MQALVSIVIITQNRMHELARCIESALKQQDDHFEILVIDNASQDGTCDMLATRFPQVRLYKSPKNLGVPGGRNLGFEMAAGEICIALDDDAEFMSQDCVSRSRQYFIEKPDLACLAFQIIDSKDKRIAYKLIPRRDRKVFPFDQQGALFSGTGFAFRRSMFLSLGGFWEKLAPYFGEEPDISYRILEQGYTIWHTTSISIMHYETPVMRPNTRRTYCGVRNAPWIAIRSLPWFSVVTLTVFGWCYFFVMGVRHGHVGVVFKGIRDSIAGFGDAYRLRKPVSRATRDTLKRYSGLYWY